MTSDVRELAKHLWDCAEARSLNEGVLSDFAHALEQSPKADGMKRTNADDVEWFRLYAAAQRKLDACSRAEEFGLPADDWRSLGVQFEKLRELYEGFKRVGAVRDVSWYLGGIADVDATDLRPIEEHLARQVLVRLRAMGLEPSAPPPQPTPAVKAEEIKTTGPGPVRRWMLQVGLDATKTFVTALAGALAAFVAVKLGWIG